MRKTTPLQEGSLVVRNKIGFSRGTGSILSLFCGWSVLEQTNEISTIFQRRCSKADPVHWPPSGERRANIKFLLWVINTMKKKGERCSMGYLLLQYREVRTQGQLKSSTLGADRDSVSCSRTLQQEGYSRVPTIQSTAEHSLTTTPCLVSKN